MIRIAADAAPPARYLGIVLKGKTVGAAGRSRSLWFLKSKVNLTSVPIR